MTPAFQYTLVTTYLLKRMVPSMEQINAVPQLKRCDIRSPHCTMPPLQTWGVGRRHATPHTRSPACPLLSVLRHSTGDSHREYPSAVFNPEDKPIYDVCPVPAQQQAFAALERERQDCKSSSSLRDSPTQRSVS